MGLDLVSFVDTLPWETVVTANRKKGVSGGGQMKESSSAARRQGDKEPV